MNRSFRAHESQLQATMKQRQQMRTSMMKEKDEELALFLEMKKREKEHIDLLLYNSEEFDAPLGSKPETSPIFNISSSTPAPPLKIGADDFLNSDSDKNDYDWLLTPPGTPLFPSLEMESQKTTMSQLGTPNARPTALKSRLASPQPEPTATNSLVTKQPILSPCLNSSSAGTRRLSSSGDPGSRSATPTARSTLSTATKPSRSSTPTSRATFPSSKPTVSTAKSLVPGTKPSGNIIKPTSNATKPTVPSRSSTPLSRSTTRSSTPTARATVPPPKSSSRAATPTHRPFTPSTVPNTSANPLKSSSSVSKSASTAPKNPPSRGTSPAVRSRPWKPSEIPGFSLDTPPNLRTSIPERPASTIRGRPGAPSSRSSSVEPGPNGRPRRQSCSPSRGRASNGVVHSSGCSMPAVGRLHHRANDNVSPVISGTKMVERLINMRKLVPPNQDDKHSSHSNLSQKSSPSPDNSGFGRSLSKKSLDMAIRHMDIRKSIPCNLRPLMTNIPASSMYSVRSGSARSRTVSVLDSPLATSSNASSEVSVNNNGLRLDGSMAEDDIGSD